MRAKTLAAIIIIGFIIAITSSFIVIAAIDAPHEPHDPSITNTCTFCHGEAVLTSPFWGTGTYDQLCLSCHRRSTGGPYSQTDAPPVTTHSDSSGSALAECRDCHNPHYQRQKVYKNTDANNLYLATGAITSCAYNCDGTSTLSYSTEPEKPFTYKSGWYSPPEDDPNKKYLTKKTGEYRRTVLFPNVNKLGYNYPIIAVDTPTANMITVEGNAAAFLCPQTPVTCPTNPYSCNLSTTFAVMYGQYIKDAIVIDDIGTSKSVKFFDKTGQNSFADGDTTYNGVCEVCHTRTENPQTHVARYRNTGNQDIDHYPSQNCICCHPHTEGFKGSESEGGIECGCCHSDLWGYMNGTTGYHHYMNNAGASYANISQPVTMGDTSDTKRNCLMCHVDHDVFRPDLNTTSGARAKNLRASISVMPSAGDINTYKNTDFDNAQTKGGICVSCHATEQTKSYTQTDNTTKTPNIEKAKFAQSAHNYDVTSTFARDSSSFNANCSKCHNDTLTPKSRFNSQSSTNKFGNHNSTLRRVTATLGISTPTDPLEEDFCYRCHSRASNANPGGGPAKTTAGSDYYGMGNMPTAGSEDVFDGSQGTISTNTLFLRYSIPVDEPAPNASASTDTFTGGTWSATEMLPTKGDSDWWQAAIITDAGQDFWHMPSFVSPQVASTTSIPAGTWRLHLWAKEDDTDVKASMRATIYVWTADDQKGTVILPPTTYPRISPSDGSPIVKLSTTLQAYDWYVEGASATLNPGDRIVVELEIESNRTSYPPGGSGCASRCATYYWNSSAYNSKVVMPTSLTFLPKESFMNTLFPSSSVPLEPDEPAPNDSASTDTFGGGTWQAFEMLDKYGTNSKGYQVIFSDTGNPDPVFWKMISFVSQPVMLNTSIPAGTWSLHLYASESSSYANAYMRATIYVWTADDTKGTVILPPTTCQDEITADIGFGVPAYDWDVTGNEATLNPGDKIVIELEIESRGAADATSATYYWGESVYYGTKFTMPKSISFMPKIFGHKFKKYSGLHKVSPADESKFYMRDNRHVECGDCHNPHAVDSDLHIPPGNAVSGPLKSVWGVGTDTNPLWSPVTTFTEYKPPTSPDGASTEFQICIKCHSYYALKDADPDKDGVSNIIGPSGVYITDQAMEFSKGNRSAHPVKSSLNNMTGNYAPKGLFGMSGPWSNTGDQRMYCADCHEPHGSTYKFSLKGPNRYWPTQSNGYMWRISDFASPLTEGLFCMNCHGSPYSSNSAHIAHSSAGAVPNNYCVFCHIAVPHGSPVSRLIAYSGIPVPYSYDLTYFSSKIIGFRKSADPMSYTMDNCNVVAGCGPHGSGDCGGLGCD